MLAQILERVRTQMLERRWLDSNPMMASRLLSLWHRSGWEFWLPLPAIALLFWAGGNWLADWVLSRPNDSVNLLQADQPLHGERTRGMTRISAEVDRRAAKTTVFVHVINLHSDSYSSYSDSYLDSSPDSPSDRPLDVAVHQKIYVIPATQPYQIETILAQKLGLSADSIRKLISYQILN